MPEQESAPTAETLMEAGLEELPPLEIEVVPEDPGFGPQVSQADSDDPGRSLDDYKFKRLETEALHNCFIGL